MRTIFADSFYYFALVNPSDAAHAKATAFTQSYTGRTVTTGWVLTELADGWARPVSRRALFLQMLADIQPVPTPRSFPPPTSFCKRASTFMPSVPTRSGR